MDVTADPQSQGSLLLSHNEALAGKTFVSVLTSFLSCLCSLKLRDDVLVVMRKSFVTTVMRLFGAVQQFVS